MFSSAIERAQKRVEENNYGIRKRLLEYDQVMNEQRETIYAERRRVLEGVNLKEDLLHMMDDQESLAYDQSLIAASESRRSTGFPPLSANSRDMISASG